MKKITLILVLFNFINSFSQQKKKLGYVDNKKVKASEILIDQKIDIKSINQNNYIENLIKIFKLWEEDELVQTKKVKQNFGRKAIVIGKTSREIVNPVLRGPSTFDSRIEVFQFDKKSDWQKRIFNTSISVGMIIEKEKINQISNEYFQIDIQNKLGTNYNLCESVPFKDQPAVGTGTAFLIEDNKLISANHVFERNIDNYVIVFNFEMINKKTVNNIIHKSNIFSLNNILFKNEELDIVIFDTKEQIEKQSLSLQKSKDLKNYHRVYSIGYPSGLPKKISVNAEILENNNPLFFYTSLDAFQGNSGSPVFDFETNKVIGVLVSGAKDYLFNGLCNDLALCVYPSCKGEKIIRIEKVIELLEKL